MRTLRHDLNYTKINLIPKYSFEPQVSEELYFDFNELVYNFGGTTGMCIGLSAISITIYSRLYLN